VRFININFYTAILHPDFCAPRPWLALHCNVLLFFIHCEFFVHLLGARSTSVGRSETGSHGNPVARHRLPGEATRHARSCACPSPRHGWNLCELELRRTCSCETSVQCRVLKQWGWIGSTESSYSAIHVKRFPSAAGRGGVGARDCSVFFGTDSLPHFMSHQNKVVVPSQGASKVRRRCWHPIPPIS
jgi:hypothetical protein